MAKIHRAKLKFGFALIVLVLTAPAIADTVKSTVSIDYANHPEMTEALTNSLKNDPSNTLTALLEKDPTLDRLIAYLQVKVQREEYEDISKIIDKLRLGTDPGGDVCKFLSVKRKDKNGDEYFINQRNIGYFMGSLAVAITKVASSETARATIAENIVNSFLSVGTIASLRQGEKAPICGLTSEMVREIANKIKNKSCLWQSGLYELSYARNLKTGNFEPLAGDKDFSAAAALVGGAITHCR